MKIVGTRWRGVQDKPGGEYVEDDIKSFVLSHEDVRDKTIGD